MADATRYRQLTELVLDFLEGEAQPQPAEAVVARVLGPAFAKLPPFVRQLEEALAGDDRFTRDGGGRWGLRGREGRAGATLRDETFVVVDVETTGGRTERHRVVEVGAVRVCAGRVAEQFSSLVKPSKPLSRSVAKLTGITPEMLETAPPADEVLRQLRAFAGDAVLVGHNVGSDLTFLNYEAVWHGLPPFGNPALDTEEMAHRLLPDLRRPGLARVATALGLAQPLRHRALPDARLAADVLLLLLARLEAVGVSTFEAAQDWLASRLITRQERIRQVRRVLPVETLRALPDLPGVYTFRAADGQALYVGKAASLHNRVAQHFTGVSFLVRAHESLLDRTVAVEHDVVDCELDALLLESARIRALRPPYNVQEETRQGCPFVRFEAAPFVRVTPARALSADEETLGPYRTTQAARAAIQAARRVFLLRSCRRTLPARRAAMRVPCLKLGQGLCLAPCAGHVTPDQYAVLVAHARRFLLDGRAATLAALDARLSELAAAGEGSCWEAETLRGCRARLSRLRNDHRPVEGGVGADAAALVCPAARGGWVLYLVRGGALAGRTVCGENGLSVDQAAAVLRGGGDGETPTNAAAPGRLDAHQANILLRWVYRAAGRSNLVPLPPHVAPGDLAAVVNANLAERRSYAFDDVAGE